MDELTNLNARHTQLGAQFKEQSDALAALRASGSLAISMYRCT